jgi:hypothetical protein
MKEDRKKIGLSPFFWIQAAPVCVKMTAIVSKEEFMTITSRWTRIVLAFFVLAGVLYAQEEKAFNGLYLNLGNLFRLSHAKTRSISAENFTGEKGKAGMATEGMGFNASRDLGQGWKVSPCVTIKPQQTFVVADIKGPGAIQQI